ncbi:helicase-associated domain-containing protein [Bailinhaonella thermotolerans]|uniref:SAP domain-containing protein n=1 Tax=Bailinhaonella thermotolerans TaxID=1070861 RepID=A0A3A4A0Z1_9ACTN|nr:helicase-associated domain-containing protein [Bailinhaonella thermotolerans]RJL20560.1 hypothetical protein D5H75_39450 [Bailinhaonella thermotolerans]
MAGLREWLAGLGVERLARVLEARGDGVAPPWPRRLDELAGRLVEPRRVLECLRRVPLPHTQVARACAVLDGEATADGLARFLGARPEDVERVLGELEEMALAWRGPDGVVRVPEALRGAWRAPFRLGRPARELMAAATSARVRDVAHTLGVGTSGHRREVIERVVGFFRDPARMGALLAAAPEGARELLEEYAWRGPDLPAENMYQGAGALRWAIDRGLVWPLDWDRGTMPREVALGVRGPGYHAPFDPEPPPLATDPVDPAELEHEAGAAAVHALDRVSTLLENLSKHPLPLLKSGGVGVKELRRLAREAGCGEDEVRLHLEVAAVARLLGRLDEAAGLVPTDRYDRWRAADPGTRLRVLLAAWLRMGRSPLRRTPGRAGAALLEEEYGVAHAHVRHAALNVLRGLPGGAAARDEEALGRSVHWNAPLLEPELIAESCPGAMAEAALLGVTGPGGGALSALGRALAALTGVAGEEGDDGVPEVEDDPALVRESERAVAAARTTALFGADLTAIVPGPPAAELAAVLDLAADREAQGVATVWRFHAAAVRRALDTGVSAAGLLDSLRAVAAGDLPQPLVYLVEDAARRHGEVAVVEVACCVRGDDTALLAEIAASRKLSRLGLRVLAPTVLASALPPAATLEALRAAGYSPVATDASGVMTVRRDAPRAAVPPVDRARHALVLADGRARWVRTEPGPGQAADPLTHARRLLAAERESAEPAGPAERPARAAGAGRTWSVIGRHASRLGPAEQTHLGFVVDHGIVVRVKVADGSEWTISHGELHGDQLDAWCSEISDYERFRLSEIVAVTPA